MNLKKSPKTVMPQLDKVRVKIGPIDYKVYPEAAASGGHGLHVWHPEDARCNLYVWVSK